MLRAYHDDQPATTLRPVGGTKVKRVFLLVVLILGLFIFLNDRLAANQIANVLKSSVSDKNTTKKECSRGTRSVSIVVKVSSGDLGYQLSQLAFAKMLQVEANERYGVSTRIQLTHNDVPWSCFPGINDLDTIDRDLLTARQYQQQQLFHKKAVLLETTADVWEESLSLIAEHWQKPESSYTECLSLPFVLVSSALPSFHQFRHVRHHVMPFLEMNHSCCSMQAPLPSDTVFRWDDALDPSRLSVLFDRHVRFDRVVVLSHDVVSPHYLESLQNLGLVVQSVHMGSPGAQSPASRYCFLQSAQKEVIAPMESLAAVWAALTAHNLSSVKLYSTSQDHPNTGEHHLGSNVAFYYRKDIVKEPIMPGTMTTSDSLDTSIERKKGARVGTPERPLVIVSMLSGEMANHLAKISYAYGVQRWLQDDYNISAVLIHRHQKHNKWIRARDDIQACFPKLRDLDVEAGYTDEFDQRWNQQREWLGEDKANNMLLKEVNSYEDIVERFRILVSVLDEMDPPAIEDNATISLPHLRADSFALFGPINDRYYHDFRNMFEYDFANPECCQERADPDESVFHLRNFVTEMKKKGKKLGYEELSPEKTANELFRNLASGDKVVIASRFRDALVRSYIDAFRARGIVARIVENHTGVQDFCLLQSARKELVGVTMSTYVDWGAYLGNATVARLYSVKSPSRLERFGDNYFNGYNYTNEILRKRMVFELYSSEEQDEAENQLNKTLRRYVI